ncbi:MAG TPA: S8 family serine peptidase [Nocardioidaceae bacterium]|nr:S8 family serine peptidase [Nocardioidaceae bacterium]
MTGTIAWSGAFEGARLAPTVALPLVAPVADWAVGGATGAGVKVAVLDSGVEGDHPKVGALAGSVAVEIDAEGVPVFTEGPHDDLVGHGTACAGIIRALAPEVELYSVRVLGPNLRARSSAFCAGIRWVIDAGMDVVNMSLSSRSEQFYDALHSLADEAYFRGVVLVCAANNMPGPTYPSEFASVVSVASRHDVEPTAIAYNTRPPVEFGAIGVDVEVAWLGGSSIVATGNSFAAPHVAALVALMRSKHPWLSPFQVKTALHAMADNATPSPEQ